MSFVPPASFSAKLHLPKFRDIVKDLLKKDGTDFEKAVCHAFDFLDLDATLTGSTQSESDVIAEAYLAEEPYFIVIECQTVRPHNQVGYKKVGQIRGNAPAYSDPRRQRLFETSHKLIVGRPAFSADAKSRSKPDVGLITAVNLSLLMLHHRHVSYWQDEIRLLLGVGGEITSAEISLFKQKALARRQQERRLQVYSLIYIALLEDPLSDNLERRKSWESLEIAIGAVLTYASLFGIRDLSKEEIAESMRDLNTPFLRVLRTRTNIGGRVEVRLSTISRPVIQTSNMFGRKLSERIENSIKRLRVLAQS